MSVLQKVVLPYLNCFWHVARSLSFTGAAANLRVSQSAVSYQIKQLEDLLGLSLFDREKRSAVRLTPGGKLLADRCQDMFSGLQVTLDALKGETLTGDLTIAAPTCFGSLILGGVIADLGEVYPDMRVHLRLADSHIDLRAEQIDMAFRTVSAVEGLHTLPLIRLPMRIVASKDYADVKGLPGTLDDLHAHNMILSGPNDSDWHSLREQVPEVPVLADNITYIDNVWGILHAIKAGHGISYLPLYSVDQEIRSGDFVEVLSDVLNEAYMVIYLNTPHRTEDSPKVTAAVTALKDMLDKDRYRNIFEWLA